MSGTAQTMETGLFATLASKVVERLPRDLDPTIAQGWIDNPSSLTRVLREALMPPQERNGTTTYSISVSYEATIEEMIRLGEYDWSNNDITSKHFVTKRTGQADVTIELVHFNRDISTEKALKELDRMGLRPAELHELLAFGAKYPEVQREFPILALGSVWQDPSGDRYCADLYGYGSERDLSLYWIGLGWDDLCRFAAVRK